MPKAKYQNIVDRIAMYMSSFLIYEGIIDQTKYNKALKDRLELIEELCDNDANSLPKDAAFLRSFYSSIYRSLMLPFINSQIEIVKGASRFRRKKDKKGIYESRRSITECSRNIRFKLGRLVEPDSMVSCFRSWKDRVEQATLTDLKRFLLATCFCDISFIKGSEMYPRNILIIHQNFFEDSYIAEHANSKHLTPYAGSDSPPASFFDFVGMEAPPDRETRKESNDLRSNSEEDRKAILEERAQIVAESMYKWVLDPNTQICVELSGNEFNVFLKVPDFEQTPGIKHLVYYNPDNDETGFSHTIQFPIKSLLGKYTLSKSAFPCQDKPIPFKRESLLNIPNVPSQQKTLFAKLSTMQISAMKKTTDLDLLASGQETLLLKQLNIDDISWIIEGTMSSDDILKIARTKIHIDPISDEKGLSAILSLIRDDYLREKVMYEAFEEYLWSPGGIEEIWIINKKSILKIFL